MLEVLKRYVEGDYNVTEYSKDGKNVSHTIRTPIPPNSTEDKFVSTIEEQILAETQYQTALLEMNYMGGI